MEPLALQRAKPSLYFTLNQDIVQVAVGVASARYVGAAFAQRCRFGQYTEDHEITAGQSALCDQLAAEAAAPFSGTRPKNLSTAHSAMQKIESTRPAVDTSRWIARVSMGAIGRFSCAWLSLLRYRSASCCRALRTLKTCREPATLGRCARAFNLEAAQL